MVKKLERKPLFSRARDGLVRRGFTLFGKDKALGRGEFRDVTGKLRGGWIIGVEGVPGRMSKITVHSLQSKKHSADVKSSGKAKVNSRQASIHLGWKPGADGFNTFKGNVSTAIEIESDFSPSPKAPGAIKTVTHLEGTEEDLKNHVMGYLHQHYAGHGNHKEIERLADQLLDTIR